MVQMYNFLIATLLSLTQLTLVFASDSNTVLVEKNIGNLILFSDNQYSYQVDLNPFGSAKVYDEFQRIYNKDIKGLPEADRINFLWSSMWHLGFDGHYMEQFQEIVFLDCGDEFVSRLEKYINNESELKRNKTKLHLSKKVLEGLRLVKKYNSTIHNH